MIEILLFLIIVSGVCVFALRRGMHQMELAPAEVSVVRALPSARVPDGASRLARFDHWFSRMVKLSRIPLSPVKTALMIVGLASVAATALFVFTERILSAAVVGTLTMAFCLTGIVLAYQRIVSQFERQLPIALDLMARAVMAGESLDQAIELVANSVDEPAQTEFRRCQNQLQMGLSMRAAMGALVERIDTTSVRIMASILSVHREAGGNLADTLGRLAEVVRTRFDYERKLKTVTGAGRASLFVVAGLAWCIFGYLFLFRPEYGSELWDNPAGHTMMLVALTLEVAGMIWAWLLLRKQF